MYVHSCYGAFGEGWIACKCQCIDKWEFTSLIAGMTRKERVAQSLQNVHSIKLKNPLSIGLLSIILNSKEDAQLVSYYIQTEARDQEITLDILLYPIERIAFTLRLGDKATIEMQAKVEDQSDADQFFENWKSQRLFECGICVGYDDGKDSTWRIAADYSSETLAKISSITRES